jgi:phage host-nuclease inhibitor protein Gam
MTGLRRANRIFKEKKDINLVKNQIEELTKEIEKLEGELNEKIVEISEKFDIDNYEIENLSLQPRKTELHFSIGGRINKIK